METRIEPVRVELQYSGAVRWLVVAAGLATCAIVAMTPWSAALRAFVALWAAGLTLRSLRDLEATRTLRVDGDGGIEIRWRDGPTVRGSLVDGGFVAHWLTIVRWRPATAWRDRTVLIVPAMAHPDALRRLRVRLRHG